MVNKAHLGFTNSCVKSVKSGGWMKGTTVRPRYSNSEFSVAVATISANVFPDITK